MSRSFKFLDIKNIVAIFVLACIAGWIYETVLEVFVWKTGFSNRGFLTGPYLPVYGFGVLAFLPGVLWIFDRRFNIVIKIVLIVIFCALVATIIELCTSYILEWTIGNWLWDYTKNYKLHYQGRIALDTSLRFGLGGAGLTGLLLFLAKTYLSSHPRLQTVLLGVAGVMVVDFFCTIVK